MHGFTPNLKHLQTHYQHKQPAIFMNISNGLALMGQTYFQNSIYECN